MPRKKKEQPEAQAYHVAGYVAGASFVCPHCELFMELQSDIETICKCGWRWSLVVIAAAKKGKAVEPEDCTMQSGREL